MIEKKIESNAHTRTPTHTQINKNPVHYTLCGDPRYPDEHAPLRSLIWAIHIDPRGCYKHGYHISVKAVLHNIVRNSDSLDKPEHSLNLNQVLAISSWTIR